MKINEYVNSKDIRNYWDKIGYKPSAPEAAWLIWQGKNQTLNEKHTSWKALMSEMVDCTLETGFCDIPQISLLDFLTRYMEIEQNLISAFYSKNDHAIYSYRKYFNQSGDREWCNEPAVFFTFEEAYEHAQDDGEPPYPDFVEFIKTYIGGAGKQIFVRFSPKKEIVRVDESDFLDDEIDYYIFQCIFRNRCFSFPTPFKVGDIVHTVRGLFTLPSYCGGTYTLSSCNNNVNDECKCNGFESCDSAVYGYLISHYGIVHYERICDYMNLEYVHDPLTQEDTALGPISKYLKGEFNLGDLLNSYRASLLEHEANSIKVLSNYSQE